eukprot:gene54867-41265_t
MYWRSNISGINAESNFAVRVIGELFLNKSGTDDGAQLWIDDVLLVDN